MRPDGKKRRSHLALLFVSGDLRRCRFMSIEMAFFSLVLLFVFLVNHVSKFLIPDGEMFRMQASFPEKLTQLFIVDAGGFETNSYFSLGVRKRRQLS